MVVNKDLKIEVGDEFKDLDVRAPGRVIAVVVVSRSHAQVVTIAAPSWASRAVGRTSRISLERLRNHRLYEKISR